jgi:hypothetical protein
MTAEAGDPERDVNEDFEEDDEDGFEFGDADEAMQCVEMAGRSTAAGALRAQGHDYEALVARKRKALSEDQPQRCRIPSPYCFDSVGQCSIENWDTVWVWFIEPAGKRNLVAHVPSRVQLMCIRCNLLREMRTARHFDCSASFME